MAAVARLQPSFPSPSPCLSSSSSFNKNKNDVAAATTSISFTSLSLHLSLEFQCPKLSRSFQSHSHPREALNRARRFFTALAVVDEGAAAINEDVNDEENLDVSDGFLGYKFKKNQARPCELYVCNLPRSCDISELAEMFKPFGTLVSVEISRNQVTGVSKGCGYVTMGSISSARKAIAALDGSDVDGREMRVRFSVDMGSGNRNPEVLNSQPIRNLIYESPYKIYVGNLVWAIKPEDLRSRFSQFGTVISARVLYDRKGGANRAYGFLSFSSAAERDAALSLNGTDFNGRVLVVKKGIEKAEL